MLGLFLQCGNVVNSCLRDMSQDENKAVSGPTLWFKACHYKQDVLLKQSRTSAVSLSHCFCTSGAVTSKTPTCPAVVSVLLAKEPKQLLVILDCCTGARGLP